VPTLLMAAQPQPQQEKQQWGRHEHGDLAMSYYILYADIAAAETAPAAAEKAAPSLIAVAATIRTRTTEMETAKTEAQADSSFDESSSVAAAAATADDAVWVEDEWTEEDERRAWHDLYSNHDDDDDEPDDWQYQQQERLTSGTAAMVGDNKNIVDDTVAWNRFYRQHRANFFKDRHYLLETFADEFLHPSSSRRKQNIMVEFGCGVGNAVWPVLQAPSNVHWQVVGVDLSSTAIGLFRNDERFRHAAQQQQEGTDRIQAFVMDITSSSSLWPEGFRHAISNDRADVATLLFCLSAIDPDRHEIAVRNVLASIRPGGVVIVRDYGRYDAAQFQLHRRRRNNNNDTSGVDHNNFYQKHDGTKVYYFTTDDLCRLFCHNADNSDDDEKNRCDVLECNYLRRVYQNRATGQARRRVWVQARFRKREIDITTVR
jgi:tRNAThr (cytosine32-N3)-methyltransferase